MNTVPAGAPGKASRAKSKGARPATWICPSTIRAIVEAAMVGCGADLRHAMIAEAAYYRAQRRGFEPGHELEDWVTAEGEIQDLWTRAFEEAPLHCGN